MDKKGETAVAVHRCRFVDYAPSAITAIAFPPLALPSIKGKKKTTTGKQPLKFGLLAIGHANGNIDICEWTNQDTDSQYSQAWVVRKTLPGPHPSKVDSLAFVIRHPEDLGQDEVPTQSDLRLFSSGGGSELLEWDIERGCIRRTISSQGGSIWSIAANPSSTSLALGCEDGTVRILSVANDTLSQARRFDRVKCRMLSIAWGPPVPKQPAASASSSKPAGSSVQKEDDSDESSDEDDEDEWTDSFLVTGGSDSSLRKWDVSTGRVVERMGVDKVRGERTLVWTVGVLGDGTIVSGDSLGMVKFWDSRTCTQLHSFQAHGADVLSMTISPEGKAIYTAGIDQKIVQFTLIKTSSTEKGPFASRWTQTTSRRMHSHDIRALAIWPPYTPLPPAHKRVFPLDIAPILASGGLDMSVVLTPAALPSSTIVKVENPLQTSTQATFEDAYHRKLAYVSKGSVRVARSARLLSCVREGGLSVWRIKKKNDDSAEPEPMSVEDAEEEEASAGGYEKVLEMDFTVHSNIVAHEISDDGRWLVVSDLYETKLFALSTDKPEITIKRVKDFSSILAAHIPASTAHPMSTGSLAFQFTPDASRLVLSTALSFYILVVNLTGDKPSVLRRFDHHRLQNSIVHDRVIKGRSATVVASDSQLKPKANGHAAVNGNGDVDMSDINYPSPPPEDEDKMDEDDDSSSDEEGSSLPAVVSVERIAISMDGQWAATSDSRGRTHIFNLDSISHHHTLPTFPSPAQCLAFDPTHPSVLLLAFPDNSVQIYDVETRQFPVWGKELAASLPRRFTHTHDPVLGVSFDPPASKPTPATHTSKGDEGKTRFVLFWGATWLFKASLGTRVKVGGKKRRRDGAPAAQASSTRPPAATSGPGGVTSALGVNGTGGEDATWRDFKMITQYRPIMLCDFLGRDELVVVERPLVDVLATLPPAYYKAKYGAS